MDAPGSEKLLVASYGRFFAKSLEFGFEIPISPATVAAYSYQLVLCNGSLLVFGAFLALLNSKFGVYLLTFLIFDISLIIHLPILYTDPKEWNLNFFNFLWNMTTIAGLWMICRKDSAGTETDKAEASQTSDRKSSKQEANKGKPTWNRKKKNNQDTLDKFISVISK